MSDTRITRVHYFEGQFLRTQDFTDEQAYHVAMRRRHNISHHTWGIVSGLTLVQEEGNFYVMPGTAVDGYGRDLILPQKQTLPSSAFIDKGSNELDVWLVYGLIGSDKPQSGYLGCEDQTPQDNHNGNGAAKARTCKDGNSKDEKAKDGNDKNDDGLSFYRWQETAQVILERPDPEFPDRRRPKGLAIPDRNFDASRTPPDSPTSYWPVYLGQIIRDPAGKTFAVDLANRPYVGLVGESIDAPSGRTRVQIGSERAEDAERFVVFTRDETDLQDPTKWKSRLSVDDNGELTIRGDASMNGNLKMAGGAIEFEAGTARSAKDSPWSIYRLVQGKPSHEELRIEMAAAQAGALGGSNQVVIGAWFKGPDETGQQKEMFHPCLTINDNGTVEISGNLVVNGNLNALNIVPGQLSEAARNAAAAAVMSGIFATSSRLPDISSTGGGGSIPVTTALAMTMSPNSGQVLAEQLAADPILLAAFAERLKDDHPAAAAALLAALS